MTENIHSLITRPILEPEGKIWIDGIVVPSGPLNIKLVKEADEQWERLPSIGEPSCYFAHKVAKTRTPDDANAYELIGYAEEEDRRYTHRFKQRVRYYKIDEEAYEKLRDEMFGRNNPVQELARRLTTLDGMSFN